MKLHLLTWQDEDLGIQQRWFGSNKDALKEKHNLIIQSVEANEATAFFSPETAPKNITKFDIEVVEIPTDKAGLMAWLNMNCHSL